MYIGTNPCFQQFLQREVTFMTSCLLSGCRSLSKMTSSLKGKSMLLESKSFTLGIECLVVLGLTALLDSISV